MIRYLPIQLMNRLLHVSDTDNHLVDKLSKIFQPVKSHGHQVIKEFSAKVFDSEAGLLTNILSTRCYNDVMIESCRATSDQI